LEEAKAISQRIWELRFKNKPQTIEQAIAKIGRRRDREWLLEVLVTTAKGKPVDEALEDATRAAYPAIVKPSILRDRAIAKLRQPDICQAMEDAFAVCGFTTEDAIRAHIGHIQGTHTRETVTSEGEVVQVRIPPSYAALQGYWKMRLPAQTAKVQIEHSNVSDMLRTIESVEATNVTEHRIVGDIIDCDPEPDPDDIDPFEDEESEEAEEE
jgi:hypothetical protein